MTEPTLVQQLMAMNRRLTAQQLAQLLNVAPGTIYKLSRRGALPALRLGTALRFDSRCVARWLQGDHSEKAAQ